MTIDKVKELIADQMAIDASEITEDSDLIEDLNADSLDIVQMLISMEKEYGVVFNDDEIKDVKTVADVVRFIDGKK